jgi:hypothetical protein
MSAELQSLDRHIRQAIDEILAALAGLDEEQLNRAPAVPGANSCFVIATHVFGNMRALVLGIVCGLDVHRVRPEEFRASGSLPGLESAGRHLSEEIAVALADLEPDKLDERVMPSQELWGEGTPEEQPRRETLMHVVEHAGIHLGQILLTVDMVRGEAPSG